LFGLPDSPSRIFANIEPEIDGNRLTADHAWDFGDALVPGAEIEYYWRISTSSGSTLETQPSRVLYQDSSLPWKRAGQGVVEIMWYEGNDAFGQAALRAATGALARIRDNFEVELRRPTRIVLYADRDLMRSALGGGTSPWVAGQAMAPFNTIVLHAPILSQELDVLIAHELTHIVIDQITRNPFSGPPAWIHEGLATYIESAGEPRFDYDGIVDRAVEEGSIISLRGLTSTFPASNSRAVLAYAETNSLMRFVIDEFGKGSVRRLLDAYRDGVTDDEAVRLTLNVSLSDLETLWLNHIDPSRSSPVNSETRTPEPMEVSGVGKVAANEPATIAASPTPVPDLVESTAPTPTREAVSGEQVASPSPVLETTSVSMESQIAPPTSVVRNVAIGSVVVIVVLIGFIVRQFVASRPGK
ncbi:MAG: peptidase MA family metallohydrolase, partial [Gammaproteobacteria bacterium]|nr:peptidase MA family metallohydrolase [Gammaproteobacteria bacterium]